MYRVIIKPKGIAENLILDGLDGINFDQLIVEVKEYMNELGVYSYEVINVSKISRSTFAVTFEDIILN